MLPLPAAITSQLDKASIIRLTISYLKLREFSGHGDPPWNRDGPPPNKSGKGKEIVINPPLHFLSLSLIRHRYSLAQNSRFFYDEYIYIYIFEKNRFNPVAKKEKKDLETRFFFVKFVSQNFN